MAAEEQVRRWMKELEPLFLRDFRWLHENPELSFREFQTTAYIRKELEEMGLEILDTGLETGLAALLKGDGEGPCIALRADIDGLPVEEDSSSKYPSRIPGVMHACGFALLHRLWRKYPIYVWSGSRRNRPFTPVIQTL